MVLLKLGNNLPSLNQKQAPHHKKQSQRQYRISHTARDRFEITKGKSTAHNRQFFGNIVKTKIRRMILGVFGQHFGISRARQRLNAAHDQAYKYRQDKKAPFAHHKIGTYANANPDH